MVTASVMLQPRKVEVKVCDCLWIVVGCENHGVIKMRSDLLCLLAIALREGFYLPLGSGDTLSGFTHDHNKIQHGSIGASRLVKQIRSRIGKEC